MIEKTLVLIKPDGVARGISGEIITRFEKVGLKIAAMKMKQIDSEFSKKHYIDHVGKDFYAGLETMITMGPVIAIALEGVEAISIVRKMIGATEPKTAAPGTIRGDYAHVSYAQADEKGIAVKNIVHASGDAKDAARELALWFQPDELFSYENVNDKYTMF